MTWTHFKNEQRKNSKEGFEHEKTTGKHRRGRLRSKWEQETRKGITQKEERLWKN
jgi:hypothetical protein